MLYVLAIQTTERVLAGAAGAGGVGAGADTIPDGAFFFGFMGIVSALVFASTHHRPFLC